LLQRFIHPIPQHQTHLSGQLHAVATSLFRRKNIAEHIYCVNCWALRAFWACWRITTPATVVNIALLNNDDWHLTGISLLITDPLTTPAYIQQ